MAWLIAEKPGPDTRQTKQKLPKKVKGAELRKNKAERDALFKAEAEERRQQKLRSQLDMLQDPFTPKEVDSSSAPAQLGTSLVMPVHTIAQPTNPAPTVALPTNLAPTVAQPVAPLRFSAIPSSSGDAPMRSARGSSQASPRSQAISPRTSPRSPRSPGDIEAVQSQASWLGAQEEAVRKQEEQMATQTAAQESQATKAPDSKLRRRLRLSSKARREKRSRPSTPEKQEQARRRHWMDRMKEAEATKKDKKAAVAQPVSPRFSAALTPAAMEKYRKAKAEEQAAKQQSEECKAVVAVLKIQSMIRGRGARAEVGEARRLEWLGFYLEHGDHAAALDLPLQPNEMAEMEMWAPIGSPHPKSASLTPQPSGTPRGLPPKRNLAIAAGSATHRLDFHAAAAADAQSSEALVLEAKRRVAEAKLDIAAMDVQRHARGVKGRVQTQQKAATLAEEREQLEALKARERSAVKLQSSMRGHAARTQTQEENRLAWLEFFVSKCDYENALQLAVSKDEVVRIEENAAAVTMQSAARGKFARKRLPPPMLPPEPAERERASDAQVRSDEAAHAAATRMQGAVRGYNTRYTQQELARVEWLNYYIAVGEFEVAMQLAFLPHELAEVTAALEMSEAAGKLKSPRTPKG